MEGSTGGERLIMSVNTAYARSSMGLPLGAGENLASYGILANVLERVLTPVKNQAEQSHDIGMETNVSEDRLLPCGYSTKFEQDP